MKKILVLTDFSRRAERAAALALDIAHKEDTGIILHYSCNALVSIPTEGGVFPYYPELQSLNEENVAELEKLAARIRRNYRQRTRKKAPEVSIHTSAGALGDGIRELSDGTIWMVVMGGKSREGKLERLLFGSETREAIEAAACPVLLVPEYARVKPVRKIGFASDLNLTDTRLMRFVAGLAGIWNASINVIHVASKNEDEATARKRQRCFDRLREAAAYPGLTFTDLEGSDVTGCIEAYSQKEGFELLAVVHRKRSLLGQAFHTSISNRLIDIHRTPLLVMAEA
jgi:nucleotide-binding universal stress UspA family protein